MLSQGSQLIITHQLKRPPRKPNYYFVSNNGWVGEPDNVRGAWLRFIPGGSNQCKSDWEFRVCIRDRDTLIAGRGCSPSDESVFIKYRRRDTINKEMECMNHRKLQLLQGKVPALHFHFHLCEESTLGEEAENLWTCLRFLHIYEIANCGHIALRGHILTRWLCAQESIPSIPTTHILICTVFWLQFTIERRKPKQTNDAGESRTGLIWTLVILERRGLELDKFLPMPNLLWCTRTGKADTDWIKGRVQLLEPSPISSVS